MMVYVLTKKDGTPMSAQEAEDYIKSLQDDAAQAIAYIEHMISDSGECPWCDRYMGHNDDCEYKALKDRVDANSS